MGDMFHQGGEAVGYDLDGVICEGAPVPSRPIYEMNGSERTVYERLLAKHRVDAALLYVPDHPFYIITGRTGSPMVVDATMTWLDRKGLTPSIEGGPCLGIYFLRGPNTFQGRVHHKARHILQLGIKRFYDDDPRIVGAVQPLVGEACQVIIWGRDLAGLRKAVADGRG